MKTIEVYNTAGKQTFLKVGQIAPVGWMVQSIKGWTTLEEDHIVRLEDGGDYEGPATKEAVLVPVSCTSKPAPVQTKPEPGNEGLTPAAQLDLGYSSLAYFLQKFPNEKLEKSGFGFRSSWMMDTGHSYHKCYSENVTLTDKGKLLIETAFKLSPPKAGHRMDLSNVFALVEKATA